MLAPLAVNVVLPPTQIEDVPDIDTVGNALTVTVDVDVLTHPLALVPVTV